MHPLRSAGMAGVTLLTALGASILAGSPALAAPPTASGSPTTGLKDGSVVSVVGHGFRASSPIYLTQCANSSGQAGCDIKRLKTTQSTATGSVSTSYTVHTGAIGDGTCGPGSTGCFIAVSDGTAAGSAKVPISFASTVTALATPSTGLTEGQTITLTGTGFPASSTIRITECANKTGPAACDAARATTAKSTTIGSVTSSFTVHLGKVGNGTCTVASTNCVIAVSAGTAATTASVPVAFARAATKLKLKLARARVTPAQRPELSVIVTAKGFIPDGKVTVIEGHKLIATKTLGKHGQATVILPRHTAGTYTYTVRYSGSPIAKKSSMRFTEHVTA